MEIKIPISSVNRRKFRKTGSHPAMYCPTKVFVIACLVLSGAACVPTASADDAGAAHHWVFEKNRFDGSSLQAVQVPSGRVLGDVFFAPDKGLGALILDGETNSIMVSEASSRAELPTKAISVEAWVAIGREMEWGGIIGAVHDNGSDEFGWLLGFRNRRFVFALATTDKPQLTFLADTSDFRLNTWYHVVGTYDGRKHQLYVNGRLVASDSSRNADILYPPTDTFYEIGAYHDSDEYYRAEGMIHEAAVYRHALNNQQIAKRHRSKKNRLPAMARKLEPFRLTSSPYARYEANGDVTVSWRTELEMPSILAWGEAGRLDQRFEESALKRTHRATLTGLQQRRRYEYQIIIRQEKREVSTQRRTLDTTFNYQPRPISIDASPFPPDATAKLYASAADRILRETGITKGYCLVYGFGGGQLAYELARRSQLIIVGVDADAEAVADARKRLSRANVYGSRITVRHVESIAKLPFTRHFANLIVSDSMVAHGTPVGSAAEMLRVLRPNGGTVYLGQPADAPIRADKRQLQQWLRAGGLVDSATVSVSDDSGGLWAKLTRVEQPGAGQWTHQYGGPGNSAYGGETLGGATDTTSLEVQWIGVPGADFGIDRQVRLSSPLCANGRLFHQGMNRIIALDAYNGAFLWLLEIANLRRANLPRDAANWCADDNRLYVAVNGECWVLDAYTGRRTAVFRLPNQTNEKTHDWGYVANAGDRLFGTSVKKGATYLDFWGSERWNDGRGTTGDGTDKVCSDELFACDKHSGKTAWVYRDGVIINSTIAIGDGRVCFVECRHPDMKAAVSGRARLLTAKDRRRGRTEGVAKETLWQQQYLVSLDAETGEKLWEQSIDTVDGLVVFYLVYAEGRILIASSAHGEYHLYVFDAAD
ncbi:MAG: methyltransferase domain-containing protein, partial [Chloroflexi bacterium]|nr:methyltransferase domain-containing protein [Chloroflexota bacterium]